ncbi:hypothetical protein A3D78_06495 [Candidatus Gottesmanbacteria bacterium RIFCSPHIGHO2_02_FULL_39_14]|uniref:O-antigen ligase-related domain-containing protein n=1 Tax=Candidatus Gottesmanbacteria bacterium RIFCSPHIGHO2_02_FULL_39_14 TaxID=1798383 RepID=A0A1F5ZWT4_9BACT|nr:MAG: hypothetical protein A3D78_06495 [Candidatus Gottesmanbacteria bacterium RIFCSPHIGHO2_02_FULL_39_14]
MIEFIIKPMSIRLPDKVIEISFYLLFFLIPLIFTPVNYELFEYNKMMLTYSLTLIITSAWLIKMIKQKSFIVRRTPLDLPLSVFLLSQIVSTVFSWDRHVSFFGYYSRFNGGLLSTISYLLLYFAFVSNFPPEKIGKLLKFIFTSSLLVSVYGILERLGIDKNIWVQDVQNRVFSTLGQPNWLAAYLAVLIPISISEIFKTKYAILNTILSLIFFLTLIFTKSRSGFLGLSFGLLVFWSLQFYIYKKKILKSFIIYNSLFIILIFLFGVPLSQISRYTLPELSKTKTNRPSEISAKPLGSSVIDIGITESSTIRNIVWRGALDIFKDYPLFGTGVETFAVSYFKYRPVEHNMTSEWDFLYNKAHNEFLNYAATTGIFGLGSYLLFIFVFLFWFIKNFQRPATNLPVEASAKAGDQRLTIGLFSAWLTIVITNFFGFSVVIIQLLFYLIPAMIFLLAAITTSPNSIKKYFPAASYQKIMTFLTVMFGTYLLFRLGQFWLADYYFAKGNLAARAQEYLPAYKNIKKALLLNQNEPLYLDEIAFPAAQIGLAYFSENRATESARFINEAIASNQKALLISPRNVNFWKTRTRILYALSIVNQNYLNQSVISLEKAKELSPTDPKIRYNLALMYDAAADRQKAYRELEETIRLKVNYRDAYLAQAVFYKRDNQNQKALQALNFILTRINPADEEALNLLKELK